MDKINQKELEELYIETKITIFALVCVIILGVLAVLLSPLFFILQWSFLAIQIICMFRIWRKK